MEVTKQLKQKHLHMINSKDQSIRDFFESLSPEEIERMNQEQIEDNERVYKEFIENLNKGICFLCQEKMNSVIEEKPCFHWFTYPDGIRKKHFEKYLSNPVSFFRLDSYFRWLANTERPFGNINDLSDEISSTSYFESTIKYKNIEWSFSIGHTDLSGHPNAKVGANPHYHIQMLVDNRVFLKFNDFHIEFMDEDMFNIKAMEEAGDLITTKHFYGEGMGMLEDEENLKIIDDVMSISDDEENAIFRRQTMISMPEGKTFSGELIQQAMEESATTKEPIGKILQRLIADANTVTIITPGDAVLKMSKRSGKK